MFTPLSSLVDGAIRRLGVERQLEAQEVIGKINSFLADELGLGQTAHAYRYARGRVSIRVDHPVVAALVREQQARLFEALRIAFPGRQFIGVSTTVRR